jgi:RNA polymerase sigma-70 factor (ECF subfamily)
MSALSPEDPRSDAELVAAYRMGDQLAASALVRRHTAPLGRYLYGVGARTEDLEDLVQEAFFKAFRAIGSWRGEASFRGWLFRIAGNVRKDQYRRDKGRVMIELAEVELAASGNPETEAAGRDLEDRLRQGIMALPRMQREVFLLRAQQGLDYDEICAALGTTPGAARVHYHHAVRRLKELMQ